MNDKIKSRTKVVTLALFDPDTVEMNFEILAAIFDAEQKAGKYLDWYGNIINTIIDKTSGLSQAQRKRFFLKWSFGHVGEFTTVSDKYPGMTTSNRILGGINVAAKLRSPWGGKVDPEWLIQQTIDIIVCQDIVPDAYGTAVDDPSTIASHREKVIALPVFASSKAVKQNQVFMISPQFMYSSSIVVYLAYLAKWFHPELFADMNPRAIHQEYLTRFLGTDFDLSKNGVFVYPK